MNKSEAAEKEKELRSVADKLSLSVVNIFFDRKDKLPVTLLKLIDIVAKQYPGTVLLTDRDWVDASTDYAAALKFHIDRSGLRMIPKPERTDADSLFYYIRAAKQFNENYSEPNAFSLRTQTLPVKRTAGRPCFGYIIKDGIVLPDPTDSRIVMRVFELTASGSTPTQTVNRIADEFPNANLPARSQISLIIGNDKYARTEIRTDLDYPPLVSVRLLFAARRAMSARKQNDEPQAMFLFRKVFDSEGKAYLPTAEKRNGGQYAYFSRTTGKMFSVESVDNAVVKALTDKLIPHLGPLRTKCIDFCRNTSKNAAKRISILQDKIQALQRDRSSRYSDMRSVPTKKEMDRFDSITADIKLTQIDLDYQQYLCELTRNADENLTVYFDELKRLNKLEKAEQRYLLNSIVSRVAICDDRINLLIGGTGGKTIIYRFRQS